MKTRAHAGVSVNDDLLPPFLAGKSWFWAILADKSDFGWVWPEKLVLADFDCKNWVWSILAGNFGLRRFWPQN